jgi:integrase
VDFDAGTITVSMALVDLGADGWRVDTPKSETSNRVVSFGPVVAEALRAQRLATGFTPWVFADPSGEPTRPNVLSDAFRRAVRAAGDEIGLRPTRFHDLRHYAAVQAVTAGVPMGVVKQRMGHSQIAITMDLYAAHSEESADRAAAAAVEGQFLEAR